MKALVRALPTSFAAGALRSNPKMQISQTLAEAQHSKYCEILQSILGVKNVVQVPKQDEYPDSVFVEDTVVMCGSRHGISMTLGHESRRNECGAVIDTLQQMGYSVLRDNTHGATLDGGDVLFTGEMYLVGLSKRTNLKGFQHFASRVHSVANIRVESITVPQNGLHLKSMCTMFGPEAIVCGGFNNNAEFTQELQRLTRVSQVFNVPDMDASNCLSLLTPEGKSCVVYRQDFPRSASILEAKSQELKIDFTYPIDYSEMAKADAALTCCSVLLQS